MSIPSARMIELKSRINMMLDDLQKRVPDSNPIEITMALVAVAGTSIRGMPGEVKGHAFGAAVAILSQEAGIRTMQARVGHDDVAEMQQNLIRRDDS